MTHWLLANIDAGDGQRDRAFWLKHLAEAGVEAPECRDIADDRWPSEVCPGDVVMVAGGDGSANYGARICMARRAILAVLPSGTANDFARNIGLPEDPGELCRLVRRGVSRHVDVACTDGRIFLNVAHVGLGTLPARESGRARKKLFGRFSYAVELLRRLNAKRGFRAEIRCGKGSVRGRWLSIAVANGAYFGGGHEIPEAAPDDGYVEVIAVKPRPVAQLLLTFVMLRLNREAPARTSTLVHLKGTHCSVRTRRPKTVTADGDIAGKTPLDVSCQYQALQVIAP
ncbi:diacylglycerol kinase family lipid kinase [Marinobacter pelagius]|uniref:diacylglycerol/lipid kinase family protein n=1 Tax=Marinobacter sp. C7 TaxID=2951363 RepID=UPI001EEFC4FA|nr:diacylglycerol kinase family protein [Marinobacter sp. C7]MCG7198866.1 diacylglycerol kinase family lipid kinase [Marinobacter sp. C7]